MQVLVNGKETLFDEVEAFADIGEVARQFTLVDISENQKYFNGDVIEVFDDSNTLFIKAEIEYIEASLDSETSEFIYAGRNKVKFIVDCYADKTTQFSQSQKVNTVLSEIAKPFGIKVIGDAQLPQQDIKTILIGEKIIDAFLEIADSAGKIITSDADGNLLIEFEATNKSDTVIEFGVNIISRSFIDNTTQAFDKYTVVAQSNYLVKQQQEVFTSGAYGSGKFHKVIVVKNSLTPKECEQLAQIAYKKDARKSLSYMPKVNDVHLELNTKYFIKDEQIGVNEQMNCKAIKLVLKKDEKYTLATFERVIK
jgi:prophage tail gpP-like protein